MQRGVDFSNFQLLCNGGAAAAEDVLYQIAEPNAGCRILVRGSSQIPDLGFHPSASQRAP
jgi:hypothetical protein